MSLVVILETNVPLACPVETRWIALRKECPGWPIPSLLEKNCKPDMILAPSSAGTIGSK